MACHGRRGLANPLSVQQEPPFGEEFGICVARCVERHNWLAHVALLLKNKIHIPLRFSECKSSLQLSTLATARPCLAGVGGGGDLPSDLCSTQHCPLPSTEDLISPFVGRCRGPCHFSSPLSRLTPPRREKGKCDPALWGKRRPYEWRPGVTRSGVTALGAAAVLPLPPPWRRLGGRHSDPHGESRPRSGEQRPTRAPPGAWRGLAAGSHQQKVRTHGLELGDPLTFTGRRASSPACHVAFTTRF